MKLNQNKKEEYEAKEIGLYNDFLIISLNPLKEKENPKENENTIKEEKNITNSEIIDNGSVETFLSDFYPKMKSQKESLKKSRFSDFFKEIEEKEKETKNPLSNSLNISLSTVFQNKRNENIKNQTSLSISTLDSYKVSNKFIENNSTNSISYLFNYFNKDNFDDNNNKISISNNNSLEDKNIDDELYEKLGLKVDMIKVLNLEDRRTTIMIKNIPNKFTREILLNIIDQNFRGTYDIFILPTDSNQFKNFGYCFINFTNSYYIPYFYYMFNGNKWSFTNSKKICEITYSKIQGKNKLLNHYPSKIVYENKEVDIVNNNNNLPREFIIPNVYKDNFLSLFPNQNIVQFPFYFLILLPE